MMVWGRIPRLFAVDMWLPFAHFTGAVHVQLFGLLDPYPHLACFDEYTKVWFC